MNEREIRGIIYQDGKEACFIPFRRILIWQTDDYFGLACPKCSKPPLDCECKDIDYYMQLPYSILLHEIEEEGKKYWIAEIPELPGCRSHGSTVEEAVKSVNEAKQDWILDSLETGEKIPEPECLGYYYLQNILSQRC